MEDKEEMNMVIFTATAVTILSAAVLILVLFAITDWWEILGIIAGLAFIAYMLPDIAKALPV